MDENGQATGFFETLVLPQVDKAAAEKYKAEVETRTVALGCGTTRRGSKVFFFLLLQMNKKKTVRFLLLEYFHLQGGPLIVINGIYTPCKMAI